MLGKKVEVDIDAVNTLCQQELSLENFKTAMKLIAPETVIIEPNMLATTELRDDHSRFFIELDSQGKVVSGSFG